MLDELGIEEREAHEFRLVEVHHEELVCRRQVRLLRRELLVEVAHVPSVFLKFEKINFILFYIFKIVMVIYLLSKMTYVCAMIAYYTVYVTLWQIEQLCNIP